MSTLIQMSTEVARRQLNMVGFKSRWIGTPQGRLHVLDSAGQGQAPAVVLLHGLSASAVHFAPILHRLRAECRRVVALDLPGHGLSQRVSGLTSARLWMGVRHGLDALDVGQFVLVGSSMGGFVATRYASHVPERLRGLILCSPAGAPLQGAELSAFKRQFALHRHADGLGFVDAFLARRPAAPIRHALAWGVRQTMADPNVRSLLASVGHGDFLRPAELKALVPPVYLIWGQREKVLPESSFRFYARNLPSSAWIERPVEFGHTPYLEHPTEFLVRVEAFLRERVGGPSANLRSVSAGPSTHPTAHAAKPQSGPLRRPPFLLA